MSFKDKFFVWKQHFSEPVTPGIFFRNLSVLFAAALAVRILLALPALAEPETLLRPDSMGYWNPALALAAGDGFVSAPDSDTPEVIRTIGYPLFLALSIKLFGPGLLAAALAGIVIGASAVVPITFAVRKVAGDRAGLLAGWLYALNMTAVAGAPLILADNLFGVLSAWQCCMAIYFVKEKKLSYLALLSLFAIAGALVKPVNLPVVFIGLLLILLAGCSKMQEFLAGAAIIIFLIGAIQLPYLVRNFQLCGGIDGNAPNVYFHNGSAIMAHATGESSEVWKNRLLEKAEKEFKSDPEKYAALKAQNAWKNEQLREMMKKYPRSTLITHLPNVFNLMPDMPSLLENNHITAGERGTMAVLRQKGLWAALNHYLGSKWQIIFLLIPFFAVHAITLLLAFLTFLSYIKQRQWRYLLLFAVLVLYYVAAPGPVISPRYLLPALPMLIFMALQPKNFLSKKSNINNERCSNE